MAEPSARTARYIARETLKTSRSDTEKTAEEEDKDCGAAGAAFSQDISVHEDPFWSARVECLPRIGEAEISAGFEESYIWKRAEDERRRKDRQARRMQESAHRRDLGFLIPDDTPRVESEPRKPRVLFEELKFESESNGASTASASEDPRPLVCESKFGEIVSRGGQDGRNSISAASGAIPKQKRKSVIVGGAQSFVDQAEMVEAGRSGYGRFFQDAGGFSSNPYAPHVDDRCGLMIGNGSRRPGWRAMLLSGIGIVITVVLVVVVILVVKVEVEISGRERPVPDVPVIPPEPIPGEVVRRIRLREFDCSLIGEDFVCVSPERSICVLMKTFASLAPDVVRAVRVESLKFDECTGFDVFEEV